MLIAREYLGHVDDADVDVGPDPRRVVLDDVERRRSRVRTETTAGTDLGVVVARDLRDGDVLGTDGDGGPVVVELAPVEAVAFDPTELSPLRALSLGHAVGNRHWVLAVRDGEALVRVADTADRTIAALDGFTDGALETRVVSVPPSTFDATGGDGSHASARGHGHGHSHGSDAATHAPADDEHHDGHAHHRADPGDGGQP